MKIISTVARYLLGILFTVFGLNGFLNFIPPMPMPVAASQFAGLLVTTHYMVPVFLIQIACGLFFLANRYLPLALTLIGPVIFNILLFHLSMNLSGIVPGAIAAVCWFLVFSTVRPAFDGILRDQSQGR